MNAVYKVRIWQEEEKVLCCSNVCTEQSCERIGTCREVEIAEVVKCENCIYSMDLRHGSCLTCALKYFSLNHWCGAAIRRD